MKACTEGEKGGEHMAVTIISRRNLYRDLERIDVQEERRRAFFENIGKKLAKINVTYNRKLESAAAEISRESFAEQDMESLAYFIYSENWTDQIAAPESTETDFMEDTFNDQRAYFLQASEELLKDKGYIGEAYGSGSEETGEFYLILKAERLSENIPDHNLPCICLILPQELYEKALDKSVYFKGYDFIGCFKDGQWMFHRIGEYGKKYFMTLAGFNIVTDLFSRNSGLLESGIMLKKRAVIVGCGSVGSAIALELARAGVGSFLLIDDDILKLHNICRHELGVRDLGRYKAKALSDQIKNIDPLAKTDIFIGRIEDISLNELISDDNSIMIATADSRRSNAAANELARELQIPFAAVGCWSRAHAGEIFYWMPDKGMPLYGEAFHDHIEAYDEENDHTHYFADRYDSDSMHFEPGISADIKYVTITGVKLILDIMNLYGFEYTPRVSDYLKGNYTLICNTNKTELGGKNAAVFPHPLSVFNGSLTKKGELYMYGLR